MADASVDAVVVAQAFHWFDIPAAAAEIDRVLVPGGGLGIVRNEWDRSVQWVDELQRLVRDQLTSGRHPSRDWRDQLEATGRFEALPEQVVPNPVPADLDTLVARFASLSFVAAMPDSERVAKLAAVRSFVTSRRLIGDDGTVQTPYLTHVLCYRSAGHTGP